MARSFFFAFSVVGLLLTLFISLFQPQFLWGLVLLVPYILIGLYDLYIAKHNVLRIYPVIGHFRYGLEFISPEIRQYFIETNQSGRPFNREHRNLVYRRAQKGDAYRPPGVAQVPRHDETVTAVVAGSAQNGDRLGPPAVLDVAGDGGARRLHQFEAGNAAGLGQAVGLVHLRDGEKDIVAHGFSGVLPSARRS